MKMSWKKPLSYVLTFGAGALVGGFLLLLWLIIELNLTM